MTRLVWTPLLAAALMGCGSCAGSRGELVAPLPNASFVTEKGTLVAHGVDGIHRVALDGSRAVQLFKGSALRVQDVTADYGTYALGDSTTTVALGDAATGRVETLEAAKGRVSEAVFSPDGKTLVLSRHADFSKERGTNDDTLFVVDVATRKVREIASTSDSWPTTLRFSADGTHLFARMAFEKPAQWIELATGARTPATEAPAPLYVSPVRRQPNCDRVVADSRWEVELALVNDAGARTVVAREEGRKRGFHDYQDDFAEPRLTPTCAYVTFGWQDRTYIAEANGSGKLASLGAFSALFFAPPF